MSDYITTYTGKHVEPLNPDEELICIEDIAHALSLLCRGNGHVKNFFSVGQHCINCAREGDARGVFPSVGFGLPSPRRGRVLSVRRAQTV